jgi:hypothetical protein
LVKVKAISSRGKAIGSEALGEIAGSTSNKIKNMPYKDYRITYFDGNGHYSENVNALSQKIARKVIQERRPNAKIEYVRRVTNKNNHL